MTIRTIQTGWTLVSSGVPDRDSRRWKKAYTGLFQRRSKRIRVPVKCFYACVGDHRLLVDAGWSREVVKHGLRHLGFGLWFASEPVMADGEEAVAQLQGERIDAVLMTHLDCDHVSGLRDISGVPVYTSREEVAFAQKRRLRYGGLAKGYDYRLIDFVADSTAPFGLSADLFGDGSVTAYLTPTHSAGSVIYRMADASGFALLVGDNGYNEASWRQGRLPGPLFNAGNMRHCLDWINKQSQREDCLGIFCAHDPQDRNI